MNKINIGNIKMGNKNFILGNCILRMRTCNNYFFLKGWGLIYFLIYMYWLTKWTFFLVFLEQGNSSSPEADLRSLSHPPRGLPAHLTGYPMYPVTGKHNNCSVRERSRTGVLKCFYFPKLKTPKFCVAVLNWGDDLYILMNVKSWKNYKIKTKKASYICIPYSNH